MLSLSARRAWIEITTTCCGTVTRNVALRKESVDRNLMTAGDVTAPSTSLSARRAWIEIARNPEGFRNVLSLSARRAWIEICARHLTTWSLSSLSARRAWIEIFWYSSKIIMSVVALRKESVDRNQSLSGRKRRNDEVALRKESVDRNGYAVREGHNFAVALRKESVDRNLACFAAAQKVAVALRKESVDRNSFSNAAFTRLISRSPQGERG